MEERIDHAERAIWLANYAMSPRPATPEVAALCMAEAQVHATLAVAKQQRIANLLMLSGWAQDATKEDIGYDLDKLRVGVAGEIWEGLGL